MSAFGLWFGGSHLGFGTHMPILAAAVLGARPGPVVEFGVGHYSTPLLHITCAEMGRPLLSLESDPGWLERFADLNRDTHRLVAVPRWEGVEAALGDGGWAVAFIDHSPDERRVVDACALAARTEFVLVHDWDGRPSQLEIARHFRHQWVSRFGPQTAVLSNFREFRGLGAPTSDDALHWPHDRMKIVEYK